MDIFIAVVKTECTQLSVPANGRTVSCSSGTAGMGFEGDTCSFTCNTGYELTGSDTRTCQSNGSWSSSDVVCREGSCAQSDRYHHTLLFNSFLSNNNQS